MKSRFEGDGLTEAIYAHFCISRFSGESDWDFRKRVFVHVFPHNSLAAVEILFGCSFNTFTKQDKAILQTLNISRHNCVLSRFVGSIAEDPLEIRKRTLVTPGTSL